MVGHYYKSYVRNIMHKSKSNGVKTIKKQDQNQNSEFIETDFGTRKISTQNWSKIVVLPKQALANCDPDNNMKVKVSLVQGKGEKYLKLTPTCIKKEDSS